MNMYMYERRFTSAEGSLRTKEFREREPQRAPMDAFLGARAKKKRDERWCMVRLN